MPKKKKSEVRAPHLRFARALVLAEARRLMELEGEEREAELDAQAAALIDRLMVTSRQRLSPGRGESVVTHAELVLDYLRLEPQYRGKLKADLYAKVGRRYGLGWRRVSRRLNAWWRAHPV